MYKVSVLLINWNIQFYRLINEKNCSFHRVTCNVFIQKISILGGPKDDSFLFDPPPSPTLHHGISSLASYSPSRFGYKGTPSPPPRLHWELPVTILRVWYGYFLETGNTDGTLLLHSIALYFNSLSLI